jgi:prephenate dehydratase
MKIAYLGPEGSHSHAATKLMFRGMTDMSRAKDELIAAVSFDEIYELLDKSEIPLGVVPIENTIGGEISTNFEQILTGNYKIFREVKLLLSHHLVVSPGASIKDIKKILVHPQSMYLCSKFLTRFPHWQQIVVSSTTEAAQTIGQSNDLSYATIANTQAAELYGLQIAEKNIANDDGNYTRFVAVVKELFDFPPGNADKCTVLFDLPNTPGMLQNALNCLSRDECNLTKIASRPIPGKGNLYRFFVDFTFTGCLDLFEFEKLTQNLKIVGIYKSGKEAIEV